MVKVFHNTTSSDPQYNFVAIGRKVTSDVYTSEDMKKMPAPHLSVLLQDDEVAGLQVSASVVNVGVVGSKSSKAPAYKDKYKIKLLSKPHGTIRVSSIPSSEYVITHNKTLQFDPTNWNLYQKMPVSATERTDRPWQPPRWPRGALLAGYRGRRGCRR